MTLEFEQTDLTAIYDKIDQVTREMAMASATYGFPPREDWSVPIDFSYDPEQGEVVEKFDGLVRSTIDVRAKLEEKVTEQAIIAELERRGYVVLGPYPPIEVPGLDDRPACHA